MNKFPQFSCSVEAVIEPTVLLIENIDPNDWQIHGQSLDKTIIVFSVINVPPLISASLFDIRSIERAFICLEKSSILKNDCW